MMKTEKRKANVGERILITEATEAQGNYGNGDVSTVVEIGVFGESGTVRVREHSRPIYASEYEVIIETHPVPKKSARITALETQVAELQAKVEALESAGKYPLTARFERESAEVDAIMADIERKAKPTPNEQRADVIKRAKAFVKEVTAQALRDADGRRKGNSAFHYFSTVPEFHINEEKRAVTVLMKGANRPDLMAKGIAKCDPDDVFNADIGKAIALARALGVEVPTEFVKAVQPTDVVVGQIVKFFGYSGKEFAPAKIVKVTNGNEIIAEGLGRSFFTPQKTGDVITDDTDAVYE